MKEIGYILKYECDGKTLSKPIYKTRNCCGRPEYLELPQFTRMSEALKKENYTKKDIKRLRKVIYFAFFPDEGTYQQTAQKCPHCHHDVHFIEFHEGVDLVRMISEET